MGIYGDTAVEVVKHYIHGQDLKASWMHQIPTAILIGMAISVILGSF
ncbi:hypothetical protein [Yersinia mollaretii]|nr:hypothetical protein [Yersinia mollaretii]